MKKTTNPGASKRLNADGEAAMTDAFDVLQTRVEAIVQSVATTHRDAFAADAPDKVAYLLQVLTSTESIRWRTSLFRMWPVHPFADSLATRFTASRSKVRIRSVASPMGRRYIQFSDGSLQSRLTLRVAVCD